ERWTCSTSGTGASRSVGTSWKTSTRTTSSGASRQAVNGDWLTLGVEEEYQIVDAEGRLRAHIDTLMAEAEPRLGELVKPEFLQSEVEVGTKICADVAEARREVTRLRGTLAELLDDAGLRLASAGTTPISHWHDP